MQCAQRMINRGKASIALLHPFLTLWNLWQTSMSGIKAHLRTIKAEAPYSADDTMSTMCWNQQDASVMMKNSPCLHHAPKESTYLLILMTKTALGCHAANSTPFVCGSRYHTMHKSKGQSLFQKNMDYFYHFRQILWSCGHLCFPSNQPIWFPHSF